MTTTGKKCNFHLHGVPLARLPENAWYTGQYLYRGVKVHKIEGLPNVHFDELLKYLQTDGGIQSIIFAWHHTQEDCGQIQLDAGSNAHGMTLYHHLSKSLKVACMFTVEYKSDEGVLLIIKIPNHVGIDLNRVGITFPINKDMDEEEVAVPGLLYAREIGVMVEVRDGNITRVMLNTAVGLSTPFISNSLATIINQLKPNLSSEGIGLEVQKLMDNVIIEHFV